MLGLLGSLVGTGITGSIQYAGVLAHHDEKEKLKKNTEERKKNEEEAKKKSEEIQQTIDDRKKYFETQRLRVGEEAQSIFNSEANNNTYIRPGKPDKKIIIGDKDTSSVELGPNGSHVQIGPNVHFNHADGGTYIRSGQEGKNVDIGGAETKDINLFGGTDGSINIRGGNGGNINIHDRITSSLKDGHGVHIRGGDDNRVLHIGDTNTKETRIGETGKTVKIGAHTHWNLNGHGNVNINPHHPNKEVNIGGYKTKEVKIGPSSALSVNAGRVRANKRFEAPHGVFTNQVCFDGKCFNKSSVDKLNNAATKTSLNEMKTNFDSKIDSHHQRLNAANLDRQLRAEQVQELIGRAGNLESDLETTRNQLNTAKGDITTLQAKPDHPFGGDLKLGRSLFNHSSKNLYLRSGQKGKNVYIGDNFDTNHVEIGRNSAIKTTHHNVNFNKPTYFNHPATFQKPVHVNDHMNINKKI